MNQSDQSRVTCPKCGKALRVTASSTGKRVKCPGCSTVFETTTSHQDNETAATGAAGAKTHTSNSLHSAGQNRPSVRSRSALFLSGILFAVVVASVMIWLLLPGQEVWVDTIRLSDSDVDQLRRMSAGKLYANEGKKLRITIVDQDGNSVSAVLDLEGPSDSLPDVVKAIPAKKREAVETELKSAADDVLAAAEKIRAGWIVKGCISTRAVDNLGRGVQATTAKASENAKRVK